MAFEVPAWDKGALAIKFKPGATPAIDVPKTKPKKLKQKKPKVKKSERKQKSKVKQKINSTYRLGKGPLAPPVESSDSEADDEMRAMHKIRSGRIEKQKPPVKAAKDQKKQLTLKPALLQAAVEAMETTTTIASAPSATAAPEGALANKLHAELMGGRFRYINEQLYTMNSKKAEDLFRFDSGAFDAYHAGYRQQVEKWPSNPLNRIIKLVKRLSKTAVIGDFGCGEGKLAQSVPNKVYSMDLVSRRADIVACNITKTPLEAQALDVAVYCLSLMGTNLNDYLLEANRVLKLHGNVYIAEIQSRFEDVREFIRFMTSCGFDLVKKDVAVNYFYFFHFRKMRHVGKDVKLKPFSLKPCLYRKR